MVEEKGKYILEVPETQQRRAQLTEVARQRISEKQLLPPVSMDTLEEVALETLNMAEGKEEELAFTMLMCSNELWRPYYEATPTDRRLLLLPQCLKKSTTCKGVNDELGLICAGCNQCSINLLLLHAENLGYSTLVAEGTTSAIALVEEGSVDAILGVSCMETLQKSFSHVLSSAIPSLAIPLLKNGCIDTIADQDWIVKEIITTRKDEEQQPLSVSLLKTSARALFTEEKLNHYFNLRERNSVTEQLAVNSMLKGGKRMRPLLALLSYSAYNNNFNEELIERLMIAVECFHKASLIHDDIEDNDEYRYAQKTAHYENGIPQAINMGDYLVGQGYRMISLLPVEAEKRADLLELFSSKHIYTSIGQGDELHGTANHLIYGRSEMSRIFRQKTGSAIEVSLLAGGIAGNISDNDRHWLSEFSYFFGEGYQINDDLTEFKGTATDQEKASYPFLKSLIWEKVNGLDNADTDWEKLIEENHIAEQAEEILRQTIDQVKYCLDKLESGKLRLGLLSIVNKTFQER